MSDNTKTLIESDSFEADRQVREALKRLLEYAERDASDAQLGLTARLIGAAMLSLAVEQDEESGVLAETFLQASPGRLQ